MLVCCWLNFKHKSNKNLNKIGPFILKSELDHSEALEYYINHETKDFFFNGQNWVAEQRVFIRRQSQI